MTQISVGHMSQLFRRVGMSLKAGVDVVRVWSGEAQRGPIRNRAFMQQLSDRLMAGDTLSEAMISCGKFFPAFVCQMVDVGEKTGRLDEVFIKLADHYDHVRALRRTFLTGIAWPAIQLFMAIMVIALVILIMGFLPTGEGGVPFDILGLGLFGPSGLVIYFGAIGLVVAGIVLGITALRKGWLGSGPFRLAMQLPAVGNWIHTLALERLTWSLAMALEAGMDARKSIRIALQSTSNPVYVEQVEPVELQIRRGKEFHEALRETGIFPNDFLNSLETAEISGTQVNSLQSLSKQYEERARMLAHTLTVVSTFLIWGLVIAILVTMIFRVFSFYIGNINGMLKDLQPHN